jgi:hypothetical protein
MAREKWFEKVLWSYMPCHRKGWATMFAIIAPVICATILSTSALDALGHEDIDWLPFPFFFVPGWLALMAITKRHS